MYDQQPYGPVPYIQPEHPYRRMGGWLLFFVILTIIGCLFSFLGLLGKDGIASAVSDLFSGKWHPMANTLVSLYGLGMNLVFLVMVFQRDQRFLRVWQLGWLASLVKQLRFAWSMITAAGVFSSAEFQEYADNDLIEQFEEIAARLGMSLEGALSTILIIMLVMAVIALGLCLLYFYLMTRYYRDSVRVRTYMGLGEYLRLAVLTKRANTMPAVPDVIGAPVPPAYPPDYYNHMGG